MASGIRNCCSSYRTQILRFSGSCCLQRAFAIQYPFEDQSVYDWGHWPNKTNLSQEKSIWYHRCKIEGLRSLLEQRAARRLSFKGSRRCIVLLLNCKKEWLCRSAWNTEILFPLQGNLLDILYSKHNPPTIPRPLLFYSMKLLHKTLSSSAWTCWETSSLPSLMNLSNKTWIICVNRSWMV